ncbi:MAG: XRE family transcriptional regulator [Alphaproteobacteria bacterium]|jgi:phage repressor protein C with HTH and peptisase S24 domain|nr:XRE family transcriptional regulator [Alphaproteobacteria bacterium]
MKRKNIKNESYGFGEVLEQAIKKKFKNQIDFANAIGVTQATVSRYISETASPSFHVLHKMSTILDIDLPLLYRKNGSSAQPVDSNMAKIPFYYSEVSAGHGLSSLDETPDYLNFDSNWLKNEFLIENFDDMFSLKVKGDSMEPLIQEGDIVFAKKFDNASTYQGIYIVCYNSDYLIKKIQFKDKNLVKLISQNPEYDPIEIDLSNENTSFTIVAKVIGRINLKSFTHTL